MHFYSLMDQDASPGSVKIEVTSTLQIPSFHIIGLPSREVAESKDRIRSAIHSSGLAFPKKRVIVNLSPSDVRKSGTQSDLAAALAILSHDHKQEGSASSVFACGELALNGTVHGRFGMTRALFAAMNSGCRLLIYPADLRRQYAIARARLKAAGYAPTSIPSGIGCTSLGEAWNRLKQENPDPEPETHSPPSPRTDTNLDSHLFPPIRLLRPLLAAASGMHHLILLGPKGSGKSEAVRWLADLLPDPEPSILLTRMLIEELHAPESRPSPKGAPLRHAPPDIRPSGLTGTVSGGRLIPGELSLAHGGVLVADEFPEWHRDSRELMRIPLQDRKIRFSRGTVSTVLPCSFLFAATGNLCECGGWPGHLPSPGTTQPVCRCPRGRALRYLSRISGPLSDRLDIKIGIPYEAPDPEPVRESPGSLKARVSEARSVLLKTWGDLPTRLAPAVIEGFIRNAPELAKRLKSRGGTSRRTRHGLVRLAMTLAALDGREKPDGGDVLEAASMRGFAGLD